MPVELSHLLAWRESFAANRPVGCKESSRSVEARVVTRINCREAAPAAETAGASKRAGVLTCGVQTTAAILLRKRKFSDTSLIISWCTESLGCVQTLAKGARRAKSPFVGKLDLFFEAEISIISSRRSTLHTLTEVVLRNTFAGIRKNYLRTQAAAYFVELIEICTERDHHEPELFALLRRAFGYLDANDPNLRAVSHFETELARVAGVHDWKKPKTNPAFALGNLFGRLPLSRAPLLKTLASTRSVGREWSVPGGRDMDESPKG